MENLKLSGRDARLVQAGRAVSESKARLARQEALVKRIRQQGELEAEALAFVVTMREFHQLLEQVLQLWVEMGDEGIPTPDFLRAFEPVVAAGATAFISRTKKPCPTKSCRVCGAPGFPASGESHRCKGRRRPAAWLRADGAEDWETCIWCEAMGVREGRECPHCGAVGWIRRRPAVAERIGAVAGSGLRQTLPLRPG